MYLADQRVDAASHFMRESFLGECHHIRGLAGLPRLLFGRGKHYWMWDFKSMSQELIDARFINIRRAHIGDSADQRFQDVEDTGRWENCLGMEGAK
jgi:hypothetical protein